MYMLNCVRMKQNDIEDKCISEGERHNHSSEDEHDEKASSAEITNPDDYKEIFQPHKAICKLQHT